MRKPILFTACIPTLIVLAIGCSKSGAKTEALILGKWRIVQDSSWHAIGAYNLNDALHVYNGQPGDYWDFRSDGFVYVKEGVTRDTLAYKVDSATAITIQNFGWIINAIQTVSTIQELTPFTAVIRSSDFQPPGGVDKRVLYLIK